MAYVVVLWIELSPAFLENWQRQRRSCRCGASRAAALPRLDKASIWIIALGLLLPTMHQSSLGTLMLLAGLAAAPAVEHAAAAAAVPDLLRVDGLRGRGVRVGVLERRVQARGPRRRCSRSLAARDRAAAARRRSCCGSPIWRGAASSGSLFAGDGRSVLVLLEFVLFLAPVVMLRIGGAPPRPRPPGPRGDGDDVRRRALSLRHLPGRLHAGRALVVLPERARDC